MSESSRETKRTSRIQSTDTEAKLDIHDNVLVVSVVLVTKCCMLKNDMHVLDCFPLVNGAVSKSGQVRIANG